MARCRDARRAIWIAHVAQESRGYGRGNPFARPGHWRMRCCIFADRCPDPPSLAGEGSGRTCIPDLSLEPPGRIGRRLLQLSAVRTPRDASREKIALFGMSSPRLRDVTLGNSTEKIQAQFVSGDALGTLGVKPALGRLLTAEDDRHAGESPVAVVSYEF